MYRVQLEYVMNELAKFRACRTGSNNFGRRLHAVCEGLTKPFVPYKMARVPMMGMARIFRVDSFIRNNSTIAVKAIVAGRWTGVVSRVTDRILTRRPISNRFHLLRDEYSFRDYLSSKDYLYNLVAKVSFARCSVISFIDNEIISVMECIIAVHLTGVSIREKLRGNRFGGFWLF